MTVRSERKDWETGGWARASAVIPPLARCRVLGAACVASDEARCSVGSHSGAARITATGKHGRAG